MNSAPINEPPPGIFVAETSIELAVSYSWGARTQAVGVGGISRIGANGLLVRGLSPGDNGEERIGSVEPDNCSQRSQGHCCASFTNVGRRHVVRCWARSAHPWTLAIGQSRSRWPGEPNFENGKLVCPVSIFIRRAGRVARGLDPKWEGEVAEGAHWDGHFFERVQSAARWCAR
ncbi:hypothetical protein KM043_011644 [Ampulex compressa]|nr:hypothetical protein KM043_011644 [Ampulex compressa]